MSTQGQRNQTQRKGCRLAQRSDVWQHFSRHKVEDGTKEIATCGLCGQVYAYHGTKNLKEHLNRCHGQESADAGASEQPPQPLPSLAQDDEVMQMQQLPLLPPGPGHGGSSDRESSGVQEEACKHLAQMIALRGYDASVLEDDCFRSFVRRLNPEFEVPSRVAIEEMCDGIFDEARRDLVSRLINSPAGFSVEVGKDKTIEAGEVIIYTACYFIDDEWNLRKLVLQAGLDPDAVGGYEHGPILGVNVVNPGNDSFGDQLLGIVFEKHDIQDRLSMVVYDDDIDPSTESRINKKTNCHTKLSCSNATFMDNVLHKIAERLLYCSGVSKKHFDATEDLTRQTRQQLLLHCGLDDPWTYNKDWYSCYCSMKVTLHKEGYSSVDENMIVSMLCKVWGTIHQAIQRIFSSTSNICLRELFNVREVLQSDGSKDFFCLDLASNTLDKAIQDSYLIWSVPCVLDPRYKREFIEFCFERAFGSEEAAKYVSQVMTRTNELYNYYYIKQNGGVTGAVRHSYSANNANTMMATTTADPIEQAWNEHRRQRRQRRQQDVIMVDQVNCTYTEAQMELHRYLQDPLVPSTQDFDILDWWKVHSSEYPTFALMARDALAWPTCSKLSSDQISQVRSMIRGYSIERYRDTYFRLEDDSEEE